MPPSVACSSALAALLWASLAALIGGACAAAPSSSEAASDDPDDAAGPPSGFCASSGAALGQTGEALSVVDRSLVGSPADYPADGALRQREAALAVSMRTRRDVAWAVAARVLRPVELGGSLSGSSVALPVWQTWHHEDDLTRIFRRLYPALPPDERALRAPFAPEALDTAWAWNDDSVADFDEWTLERLAAYREALDTSAKLGGVGGVYRVGYSPAASRHALENYGSILACRASDARVEAVPPLASAEVDRCAGDPSFLPACLDRQFPSSSALTKATWQRLDAGLPFFAYDTSSEALEQKLASGGPLAWGDGDRPAAPGDGEIYAIELPNGNRFGLTGLHIMTKELEHWVWLTLWWSDRPDEDFGADRPADFPAPFASYKLCGAVWFEEGDADPAAVYAGDHPTLARALEVTRAEGDGATWCSNPYIERGAGNLATNCIGCHQHAGTRLRSEEILAEATRSAGFARREVRQSFPTDYVFSVRTGDDLGAMFEETVDYYAPRE
jgi:hypothetical protein